MTTSPPLDYHGREKLSTAEFGEKKKDEEAAQPAAHKTICGLRRRTFLIILVVAAVVVIGAVVGGVVGGLKSKHSSSDGDSTTPPPPAVTPSGPIQPSQRALAVAASANISSQDIAVFYTALQTQSFLYRRLSDSGRSGGDEHTVTNLTITPDWGTSLAAAALNGSEPVSMQLFYLATANGTTAIAQALLQCPPGQGPCTTMGNSLVSNGTDAVVYNSTRLAALRFDQDTARVFFQTPEAAIYTLNGGSGPGSWTKTMIRQAAHIGSGLLAYAAVKDAITLFFVGSDTLPRLLAYSDVLGPGKGKQSFFFFGVLLRGMDFSLTF